MSLFNGEDLEIHHILPRREGEDHSLKNLKLLHKLCHKQVEYSKDSNLRATWLKKGILFLEKRKIKVLIFDEKRYSCLIRVR